MKTIYLIADEPGAKGYSDKQEGYYGEVGVMAGLILQENNFNKIKTSLDKIKTQFSTDGKTHITDLPSHEQQEVRDLIFDLIHQNHITCIYEAIHSQGLYEAARREESMCRPPVDHESSRIKVSVRNNKELLHERLFTGLFAKAVAWGLDNVGEEFHLSVITDKVDSGVEKRWQKGVDEFLDLGEPTTDSVTGFDTETKQVITTLSITSEIKDPGNHLPNLSGIKYTIKCEDSGITLAADVLVNSLHYNFKQRDVRDQGKSLNTREAISEHRLQGLFYGFLDADKDCFSDLVFKHPNNGTEPAGGPYRDNARR